MKIVLVSLLHGAVLGAASVIPDPLHKADLFNWDETKYLVAFGDSYTYVQGTLGHQNFSFIGDLQNFSYTPAQLLSNEIVQNQISTSAGGPNWVEYLTNCFSGLPSKCKTQLWDFAFAGSDISTSYTPLHHPYTISLEEQIRQWALYANPVLKLPPKTTLVAVFIGINDISDSSKYTFPRNGTTNFKEFYELIIAAEMKALERVYEGGYRNFLFMNLPPLDRTPGSLVSANPLPNKTMVQTYNTALAASASSFQNTHPGTNALVFDTYSALSGVLDHPSHYGIKNITNFCPRYDAPDIGTNYAAYGCQPLNQYFWYNSGHITSHVHQLLAQMVGEFLRKCNGER